MLKIAYCPCTAGGTELSPPDLWQNKRQISPEKFHNLLSLASSPPLSSHIAGANASLNPTALEFIPGKESHDMPPVAATTEKASTPSFAQVCMPTFKAQRIIAHFYQALSKGEKKPNSDVRFPAVKVTTPPKGMY